VRGENPRRASSHPDETPSRQHRSPSCRVRRRQASTGPPIQTPSACSASTLRGEIPSLDPPPLSRHPASRPGFPGPSVGNAVGPPTERIGSWQTERLRPREAEESVSAASSSPWSRCGGTGGETPCGSLLARPGSGTTDGAAGLILDGTPACLPGWARRELVALRLGVFLQLGQR
jgi:hypothetical protein